MYEYEISIDDIKIPIEGRISHKFVSSLLIIPKIPKNGKAIKKRYENIVSNIPNNLILLGSGVWFIMSFDGLPYMAFS